MDNEPKDTTEPTDDAPDTTADTTDDAAVDTTGRDVTDDTRDDDATTPWAKDLENTFEDETVRGSVDEFLRDNVQPYVTKLEQQSAENRYANRLWEDFTNDPENTYRQVTEEIFGEEVAEKVFSALERGDDQEPDDNLDDIPDDPAQPRQQAQSDEIPERLRPIVDDYENRRREEEYNQAIDRLQEDNPDIKIDKELFHPFVAATQGDLEVALEGYKEWSEKAKDQYGLDVKDDQLPKEKPPATLEQGGGPAPPQEKTYTDFDDALDAFFAEQERPPTPVGST